MSSEQLLQAKADAYDVWQEKTDWVQDEMNAGLLSHRYLGRHRADILKVEIERLREMVKQLEKKNAK